MRALIGLVAGLLLLSAATSCTSTGSEPIDSAGSPSVDTGTPSSPVLANPQPKSCPSRWKYTSLPGSDTMMVPGDPVIAVRCSVINRSLIRGSQLSQLLVLLNGLHKKPRGTCLLGAGFISSQLYFNYASGDVQVVNFDPACRSVSNGTLAARFAQATSGMIAGLS